MSLNYLRESTATSHQTTYYKILQKYSNWHLPQHTNTQCATVHLQTEPVLLQNTANLLPDCRVPWPTTMWVHFTYHTLLRYEEVLNSKITVNFTLGHKACPKDINLAMKLSITDCQPSVLASYWLFCSWVHLMRAQMRILYSNKSNNDSGRIGKEAAMSYLSTYQMSRTTTNPSQENQL